MISQRPVIFGERETFDGLIAYTLDMENTFDIPRATTKVTMFGKLKLGDRFTKDGVSGIFTKTGERESWCPKHRMLLFPDSMVRKLV